MKILLLSICLLLVVISGNAQIGGNKGKTPHSVLVNLKSKKAAIDKYANDYVKDMVILVKVPGKKNLIRIYNGKWPDEIEYTYNVLKDKAGKIIYILQSPYSESGDWDIAYKHYFDENGHVFAFDKQESIFTDEVRGGVVRETQLNYFDSAHTSIYKTTKLTNAKGLPVKGNSNKYDFRDYKYVIYKNLAECIKGYNIQTF